MNALAAAPTTLIDAGNTRCKVAILDEMGAHRVVGSLPTQASISEWAEFFAQSGARPVSASPPRALGVCVAGDAVKAKLAAALGCEVVWADGASALAGFENHYDAPQSLGADRYLAAYGAALHAPERAFVLATVGTATTVDWISWDAPSRTHRFEGGLIVAGLELMQRSLASGTAQLPDASQQEAPPPALHSVPRSTHAALVQGAYLAQVAVVQAFAAMHPQAQLLLAGGHALRISPHLSAAHAVLNQPALAGLARLATLSL